MMSHKEKNNNNNKNTFCSVPIFSLFPILSTTAAVETFCNWMGQFGASLDGQDSRASPWLDWARVALLQDFSPFPWIEAETSETRFIFNWAIFFKITNNSGARCYKTILNALKRLMNGAMGYFWSTLLTYVELTRYWRPLKSVRPDFWTWNFWRNFNFPILSSN